MDTERRKEEEVKKSQAIFLTLLLVFALHAFAQNPLAPEALPDWRDPVGAEGPTRFVECGGGMVRIGHAGRGFCFDNETPAHRALVGPVRIARNLVSNGEWRAFIEDDGPFPFRPGPPPA